MPPYGDLGRPAINWRLVRPGDTIDIGPLHADYWFDAVLDGWRDEPGPFCQIEDLDSDFPRRRNNRFRLCARFASANYSFRRVHVGDGHFKPDLREADLDRPLQTLSTPPGTAVMFNYNLIHRGANSGRATRTRVSMEFAINIPRDDLEARYGNIEPIPLRRLAEIPWLA